jgi:hypothetical protein
MRLSKADVGTELIVLKWRRESRSEIKVSQETLTSVGRVNMVLGSNSYKILSSNEFSIKASAGDASDHWVKIYRTHDDVKKDEELSLLSDWFSDYSKSTRCEELSMEQLQKIKSIINGAC